MSPQSPDHQIAPRHVASHGRVSTNHVTRTDIAVHDVWRILVARHRTFFACFALFTVGAIVISLALPKRYEAVARLSLDFESSDALNLETFARTATGVDSDTKLQTQVKVLQTDSLAWEVIKQLRLDQRREAAHRRFVVGPPVCVSKADETPDSIGPECRHVLLEEFQRRLRVQSIPRTQIVEIRFRSQSPELAAKVVNKLADSYIESNFRTKYEASMRVSSWLSGQMDDVKRDAENAEEKFIAFQRQVGMVGTDENHNVLIERLNALNQQLVVAEANRIVREARYRVALSGDPQALADMTPGSPLQLLRAEEINLRNQYAQLDSIYGENYPRIVQMKEQIEKASQATNAELTRVRDKAKSEYEAALKTETMLRDEFEGQKQQAYKTNEAAVQAALMKRDVDASRELYEQLTKKLKEAGILAGLKANNVTVIDPAMLPVKASEPLTSLNILLGMVLGGVCGVGTCLLSDQVDTTIKSATDIHTLTTIPTLGVVPRQHLATLRSSALLANSRNGSVPTISTLEEPESIMADAYRSLRTAILLSSPGAVPKSILITSPLPREGKTTTTVNTAVVFAQHQRRVLVVDGDLRRRDLHRYLHVNPTKGGLSLALVGEDPSQFYMEHPQLPNLVFLPAGERPPKPPDLLDSERMRQLLADWRQQFDHVFIDAPPIIGLSDSVIMSTMVDMVMLVVRSRQSERQHLIQAQELIAGVGAKIAGAVINDYPLASAPYGYGHQSELYHEYFIGNGGRNGRG